MGEPTSDLLRALLAVTARSVFPPDALAKVVVSGGGGEKQLQAYNLCDGSRGQSEVAKIVGIDSSNFSKTVGRWIDSGVLFKVGENREVRLLHLYQLPKDQFKKKGIVD